MGGLDITYGRWDTS